MPTEDLTFPRLVTYTYPNSTRKFAPIKAYSQSELDLIISELHRADATNILHAAQATTDQYGKYDTETLIGLRQMAESNGFDDDVAMWDRELAKPERPKED